MTFGVQIGKDFMKTIGKAKERAIVRCLEQNNVVATDVVVRNSRSGNSIENLSARDATSLISGMAAFSRHITDRIRTQHPNFGK